MGPECIPVPKSPLINGSGRGWDLRPLAGQGDLIGILALDRSRALAGNTPISDDLAGATTRITHGRCLKSHGSLLELLGNASTAATVPARCDVIPAAAVTGAACNVSVEVETPGGNPRFKLVQAHLNADDGITRCRGPSLVACGPTPSHAAEGVSPKHVLKQITDVAGEAAAAGPVILSTFVGIG